MTYHLYIPPYSESKHYASWSEVFQALDHAQEKQLGRNILLHRMGEQASTVYLKLYDTDILAWDANGFITINTGGYYTKATCEILNRYLPPHFRCVPEGGQWYIYAHGNKYPMFDWMKLNITTGAVHSSQDWALVLARQTVRENAAMKKRIAQYLADLNLHTLVRDTKGDPWCCIATDSALTLADATNDHSHLMLHMEEKYYPFALLVAAFKEYQPGNWQTALAMWTDPRYGTIEYVRRVLGKYMKKRLLTGAVSYR